MVLKNKEKMILNDCYFLEWCEDTLEDENGLRRHAFYWINEFLNNIEWMLETHKKYLKEKKEKK